MKAGKRVIHLFVIGLVANPIAAEALPSAPTRPGASVFETSVQTVAAARTIRRPLRGPIAKPNRPIRPVFRPNRPIVKIRPWVPRRHFGRVVAGVVLGTVIVVAVAGSAPAAPAANLCWYWTNSRETRGYWDYCQ